MVETQIFIIDMYYIDIFDFFKSFFEKKRIFFMFTTVPLEKKPYIVVYYIEYTFQNN